MIALSHVESVLLVFCEAEVWAVLIGSVSVVTVTVAYLRALLRASLDFLV